MAKRLETLEAIALLCCARLLIALVRFEHWRHWLGSPKAEMGTDRAAGIDWHCTKVVNRALRHLPLQFKCLPQAMALHWMLRRRKRNSQIVFAALPEADRRGSDDLHAWVEMGGVVLIGETEQPHRALVRFGSESRN